jgi:hypothetical protein
MAHEGQEGAACILLQLHSVGVSVGCLAYILAPAHPLPAARVAGVGVALSGTALASFPFWDKMPEVVNLQGGKFVVAHGFTGFSFLGL